MTDLFAYLKERPYPGRGILLGATPAGKVVCAYFIMGRSENSRNRVFEKTDDGIRTRAWDESKMTDPSLIIYHPVRRMPDGTLMQQAGQSGSMPFESGQVPYSVSRQIEYNGEPTQVSLYWDIQEYLPEGVYTAELFSDGYKIGRFNFTLGD